MEALGCDIGARTEAFKDALMKRMAQQLRDKDREINYLKREEARRTALDSIDIEVSHGRIALRYPDGSVMMVER